MSDNIQYAKCVKFMGTRDNAAGLDFSGILDEVRQRQFGKGEEGGIRHAAGRSGGVSEGEGGGGREGLWLQRRGRRQWQAKRRLLITG